MENPDSVKEVVKNKYSVISKSSVQSSCCGQNSFCDESVSIEFSMIGDDYKYVCGYVPEADLGLGCGLPTEYAG